jgi:hypothetical protein
VKKGIQRFEAAGWPITGDAAWVTTRFRSDPLLRKVHDQLKRKNRKTGRYLRQNRLANPAMDVGEALDDVLGRALYLAACALRDHMRTDKGKAAAAQKAEMLHEVAVLRKVAAAFVGDGAVLAHPFNECAIADASHMLRAAERWEAQAATLKGSDDPLVIRRDHHQGNNMQEAIQCLVAVHFKEYLGGPMHGLAAIIAGIAMDRPALGESVSRAALRRPASAR